MTTWNVDITQENTKSSSYLLGIGMWCIIHIFFSLVGQIFGVQNRAEMMKLKSGCQIYYFHNLNNFWLAKHVLTLDPIVRERCFLWSGEILKPFEIPLKLLFSYPGWKGPHWIGRSGGWQCLFPSNLLPKITISMIPYFHLYINWNVTSATNQFGV